MKLDVFTAVKMFMVDFWAEVCTEDGSSKVIRNAGIHMEPQPRRLAGTARTKTVFSDQ
jgi:hypothetical protein